MPRQSFRNCEMVICQGDKAAEKANCMLFVLSVGAEQMNIVERDRNVHTGMIALSGSQKRLKNTN